jgi:glycosyltransferase involved in cell wall biosynthesis
MRKVLIITYYWPPSGGSGVQRWLKFAKYLPQYGWQPVVYTPENPDFSIEDNSLLQDVASETEVLKTKIWEPYEIYKALTGNKGKKVNVAYASSGKKSGRIHKLALALRGNLLIPDPRCFWIKPSVKFLSEYLRTHPVDAIITTGPPHSMHIIGLKLHRKTQLPWIADFRDPWTNIDFYKELNLTRFADKLHHRKEQQVIAEADCVVSVTPTWCAEFETKHPKKIALVHNGYDEADVATQKVAIDDDFSLVHIGSVNAARNPKVLWKALSELLPENKELASNVKIKLVGNIEGVVFNDIEKYRLGNYVDRVGYLSHKEAVAFQQKAQILLLLINNTPNANGILTGKLYEYMASGRPTLAIGPDGSDIAKVLNETGAGVIVDFDDVEGMKRMLLSLFNKYKTGTLTSSANGYEQYSRRAQCGVMADLLDEAASPLNPPQGT